MSGRFSITGNKKVYTSLTFPVLYLRVPREWLFICFGVGIFVGIYLRQPIPAVLITAGLYIFGLIRTPKDAAWVEILKTRLRYCNKTLDGGRYDA